MSDVSEKDRAWDRGWDDHRRAQLRRQARLPLREKLAWLEEMQRVARHLEEQRTREGRGTAT